MKVSLLGGSGFLGRAIRSHLVSGGHRVRDVERSSVDWLNAIEPNGVESCTELVEEIPEARLMPLVQQLEGSAWIVNAAGKATPTAPSMDGTLLLSNVVLPVLLQRLATKVSGVPRLLHISSAAVQMALPVLNETTEFGAETAYAKSKAAAEQALLASPWKSEVSTLIYRPTSVHGRGRHVTRSLQRAIDFPLTPIVGGGTHPIPLTSGHSVSRAVGHILNSEALADGIVLHPWEGVTQSMLLSCSGRDRRLRLPQAPIEQFLRLLSGTGVSGMRALSRTGRYFARLLVKPC